MSSYNKKPEDVESEPHSNRCPAAGCPMMSSIFIDGGPWACRYHSKQPTTAWLKITDMLNENKRWFMILKAAENIMPDEYDTLQKDDSWELDELIRPVKGELHPQWVHRVKETIYRALKDKVNKITDMSSTSVSSGSNRLTIHQLTSGVLKKSKVKL